MPLQNEMNTMVDDIGDMSPINLGFEKIRDLRVSIIGNKDLKYKLIEDTEFIRTLVASFKSHIQEILVGYLESNQSDNVELFQQLEREAVILKLLISFLLEVNDQSNLDIGRSLICFEEAIDPIFTLLGFYIRKFNVLCAASGDPARLKILENTIKCGLDICICFSSSSRRNNIFDSQVCKKLWKFVVCLLLLSNDHTEVDSLLIKVLQLVPLILKNTQLKDVFIITLISSLIKRLGKDCNKICFMHFPEIITSKELLNKFAFESKSLPNVELKCNMMKSVINMPLLTSLIICTAQVFSFLKENDYDIYMAPPLSIQPNDSSIVVLSVKIYAALLLLLKYPNIQLNLASLNLIGFYLNYLRPSSDGFGMDDKIILNNYQKLFPIIVDMLITSTRKSKQINPPAYLFSPGKVLANLCTQYSSFNDEIRKVNIDYEVLKILDLNIKSSQKLKQLKSLKKLTQNTGKLADFSVLLNTLEDDQSISDLLLLLSIYTGSNEEYRNRITSHNISKEDKNPLIGTIFEIVDVHRFLLNQLQLYYQVVRTNFKIQNMKDEDLLLFSGNLGILISLLENSIFTNCLYFIRSLSRSVSTLRTFFVECNSLKSTSSNDLGEPLNISNISNTSVGGFIDNFLYNLKGIEDSGEIIKYFSKHSTVPISSNKARMINKSIALGTIANFVLDFSSFRYEIVNDGDFVKLLLLIYDNSTTDDTSLILSGEEIFQRNMVQLNVLQILKNLMFNENNETKAELIEVFPLDIIFQKASYGLVVSKDPNEIKNVKLQQKIVAFDILRNATAGSPNFNEVLVKNYENEFCKHHKVPKTWTEFLITNIQGVEVFSEVGNFEDDEFLLSMILNNDYLKLITAINYIEDHKYTNIDIIKYSEFPKDELLSLWLRFLQLSVPPIFESKLELNQKITLNNNLNEIKISIVWILINLTWKRGNFGYHLREFNNFSTFNTVEEGPKKGSTSRIDIEDSDESDTGSVKDETSKLNFQDTSSLTALDRARYLSDFGFSGVLSSLIHFFSKSSPSSMIDSNGKRFDWENSNDLYEKIMTANHQISGLVGHDQGSISGLNTYRRPYRSYRRVSTSNPQDVNRGGEGFGYESDDYGEVDREDLEMQNAPDTQELDHDDYWTR